MDTGLGSVAGQRQHEGEFENRLKAVIEEVKASPVADHYVHRRSPYADRCRRKKEGQGDAANLLKPALARGN